MRRLAMLLAVLMLPVPAYALDIKLDDTWIPRLGQLCDAARYAARMAAEPICNDLAAVVQKAQADEAKKKSDDEKTKPPAN